MRVRLVLASTALTVLALPAAGQADALRVTGTVRDVYGTPVQTCITAQRTGLENETIVGEPDGTYSLDLLPGSYTITAHDLITPSSGAPHCNFGGAWSPKRFNNQAKSVAVPSQDQVDFSLKYFLSAGPENALADTCCTYGENAMRPGTTMQLYATLHRAAADRGFVRWRGPAETHIVLQPSGQTRDWIHLRGEYPIPDIPETSGGFESIFDFVDSQGVPAANSKLFRTHLDGEAPVFTDTYPREGNEVTEKMCLTVTWTDNIQIDSSRGVLYDVTSGNRVETWRGNFSYITPGHTRSPFFTLTLGHRYEADFTVTDRAENISRRTVSFSIEPREDQLTDPAPLRTVTSPLERMEISYGDAVDPENLRFTIKRLTAPAFMLTVRPSFDSQTRRAWVEYAEADPARPQSATGFPPLFEGTYEVTVQGSGPGTETLTRTWTFDVHLGG